MPAETAVPPTRNFDVAIVGAGLAGSVAAAMVGRTALSACVIDLHREPPDDFRCEALTQGQADLLARTGLFEGVVPALTASSGIWVARHGKVVERSDRNVYGIHYPRLVSAVRSLIPARVPFIEGNVADIAAGPDRQTLTLSDGRTISARLVILATGGNARLRRALGIGQTEFSPTHSISFGFDLRPATAKRFSFPALHYYSESIAKRTAYIALFPIGETMRANLFVYRELRDPWLSQFRQQPREHLIELLPNLRTLIGDFAVEGPVQMRPVDLYEITDAVRDGVVLVGDAFANSCPAAGTGTDKVFVDVERLCSHYLPQWFATEGMSAAKIAAFYDDPVKNACDAYSRAHAIYARAFAIDTRMKWRAMRLAKYAAHRMFGAALKKNGWVKRVQHAINRLVTG